MQTRFQICSPITWTGSDAVIKGLLKGLDADGNVDKDASRRVEVKFRLKDDEMIDELNQIMTADESTSKDQKDTKDTSND